MKILFSSEISFFFAASKDHILTTTSPAAGLAQPTNQVVRAHMRQVQEGGARLAHLHKHLPHELRIARDVQVVRGLGLGEPSAKRVHASDVFFFARSRLGTCTCSEDRSRLRKTNDRRVRASPISRAVLPSLPDFCFLSYMTQCPLREGVEDVECRAL